MPQTQLREQQINFREIFSPVRLLSARGFKPIELPLNNELQSLILDPTSEAAKGLYLKMNNPETRLQSFDNSRADDVSRKKYSDEFEWYVGELMMKEFSSFSYGLGTMLKGAEELGDYDTIITARDLSFIYFECKSNNFQGDDIFDAIKRAQYIHSDATIIAYGKKFSGNQIKEKLTRINDFPGLESRPLFEEVSVKQGSGAEVAFYRWYTCYFIRIDENVEKSLRAVLHMISARKNFVPYHGIDADSKEYERLGIHVQSV